MENAAHAHVHEHRDDYGAKLGMWIFLFTEMFLFGGLFLLYAVARYKYASDFHGASLHLDTTIGAINSVLLLISSMTISFAVIALKKNDISSSLKFIGATLFLALIFLINKLFEWNHKIELQLYPGSDYLLTLQKGYKVFFDLYFFMTGLHALHLIVGIVLLSVCLVRVKLGTIHSGKTMLLVNSTLYWHLVDLIWIFLFPLLYLIP